MRKGMILFLLLALLALPVSALELVPPSVPESGSQSMPQNPENLTRGFWGILQEGLEVLGPALKEAARVCLSVLASVMLISILKTFSGTVSQVAELAGAAAIAGALFLTSDTMIRLGTDTIWELTEYGKLLLPVMTAALAAQGGLTKSAAVFAGTATFTTLLETLISRLLIPMTYLFLAMSVGNGALGEDMLKRLRDLIKSVISWTLKTILTVFTTYIGLTGVVSGTADAAALKAAKATMSTVVPVVGSILSGASEAVLLSAGAVKNTAGIYGIFALLAVLLRPFVRILAHYWLLKLTAAVCGIFGGIRTSALVADFSTAMGFLLAMTGAVCSMLLIGTVCFMKGVG